MTNATTQIVRNGGERNKRRWPFLALGVREGRARVEEAAAAARVPEPRPAARRVFAFPLSAVCRVNAFTRYPGSIRF